MAQQTESNIDQWKIPNQINKEVDEEVVTEDERGDVETTEDETEELSSVADATIQTDEALKVLANVLTSKSLGKANPSSGEYFYLH